MAYCGPRGIPLSRFLAWPEDDQEAALAWLAHEAQICKGCGTHPAEWDEREGGSRRAFDATVRECPGCARISQIARDESMQLDSSMHIHLVRPH